MSGNLDLNVMMPIIGHALLEAIAALSGACRVLAPYRTRQGRIEPSEMM